MKTEKFETLMSKMSLQLDQIISMLESHANKIKITGDLGRLDFVSVLLASIGVLIALSAIYGFGYIDGKSRKIAAQSASKKATEVLKPYLNILFEIRNEIRDLKGENKKKPPENLESKLDKEVENF